MIEKKTISVIDNEISVLQSGDRTRKMILFLHGIPSSAELWRNIMMKIPQKDYLCLAPDLSGYGETHILKRSYYSLTDFAELLLKMLEENHASQVNLVAHDIGGGIAQIMMTKRPDLFSKVILSNCVTGSSWPIPNVQKMIKASKLGVFYWLARFGQFSPDKLFQALSKSFVRSNLSEDDFFRIFYDGKFNNKSKIKKFQRMLKVLSNSHTITNMESLSQVDVPVDLIWAMNDKFQPWEKSGVELQSTLINCEVFHIQNSGHFLQIDAYEEYTQLLLERLA